MASPVSPASQDARTGFLPWVIALLIFTLYLFIATRSTIWDRDEARFARATYEMVTKGNYLFATFNNELRPDKPILIYWLMSVPVRLLGQADWVYRLCAVIATALSCLLTFFIGKELLTRRAGLWAMAILGATPLMFMCGAVATSDAVLLAFMTAQFLIFARILKRGWTTVTWPLLTLMFSGGMLTKGPVALIPGACFIVTIFWIQILKAVRPENSLPAVGGKAMFATLAAALTSVAVFALWFFPANGATDGKLWDMMVGHHFGDRITMPLEHHGGYSVQDFAFYFVVIATAFFPWILFLPSALAALASKPPEQSDDTPLNHFPRAPSPQTARIFLWSWIGLILIVMIAVATKLPHYILPIWPALALSVGALFDFAPARREALWSSVGSILYLSGVAGAIAGAVYLFPKLPDKYPPWGEFVAAHKDAATMIGAAIGLLGGWLAVFNSRTHFRTLTVSLLAAAVVTIALLGYRGLPAAEELKISAEVARKIHARVGDNVPLAASGYFEASLVFYSHRPVVEDISSAKQLADWASRPGQAVLVIPRHLLEKFQDATQLPAWRPFDEVKGWNYSKGMNAWVDVLLITRE